MTRTDKVQRRLQRCSPSGPITSCSPSCLYWTNSSSLAGTARGEPGTVFSPGTGRMTPTRLRLAGVVAFLTVAALPPGEAAALAAVAGLLGIVAVLALPPGVGAFTAALLAVADLAFAGFGSDRSAAGTAFGTTAMGGSTAAALLLSTFTAAGLGWVGVEAVAARPAGWRGTACFTGLLVALIPAAALAFGLGFAFAFAGALGCFSICFESRQRVKNEV